MGTIRGAVDKAGSMQDTGSRGLRRDPSFAGDPTPAAAGQEYRDPQIDTIVEFGQVPVSSRSRGYGRYEI